MTERDSSSPHVDPGRIERQLADGRHRDGGKRLVDLEEIDIRDLPAGLVEQFLNRADRCRREPLRRLRDSGVGDDPRDGGEPESLRLLLRGNHEGRRPVVDLRGVRGSDGPILLKRGL